MGLPERGEVWLADLGYAASAPREREQGHSPPSVAQ
jgi:hypothetical protein